MLPNTRPTFRQEETANQGGTQVSLQGKHFGPWDIRSHAEMARIMRTLVAITMIRNVTIAGDSYVSVVCFLDFMLSTFHPYSRSLKMRRRNPNPTPGHADLNFTKNSSNGIQGTRGSLYHVGGDETTADQVPVAYMSCSGER